MSEHIEIQSEPSPDPHIMIIHTNLRLSEGRTEAYVNTEEMEEGSALAHLMATIDGIHRLVISERDLRVTRFPEVPWHSIISEMRSAIRDFYL